MTTTEMTMISLFSMKPEYIEEVEVDGQTEVIHKAACVWKIIGSTFTQKQLKQYCALYGITIDDALNWKPYWV